MFYKTMGVTCDFQDGGVCSEDVDMQGREATTNEVTAEARRRGWAISSAGHFCPEHRQRRADQ